jgi:hypothetical protein
MERIIAGMRISSPDSTDLTVEEFVRIHQPLTELMTDEQKKAFNKELRAFHKELKKNAVNGIT